MGGWRVIRTLGKGLVEIEAPQGMAAESSSAAVILLSSHFGYSLSTTHVATGSILGTGLGKKGAEVRWNVAGRMATAWLFTLPAAGLVGAGGYALADGIGGTAGVIVVLVDPGRGRRRDLPAVAQDRGQPRQRQRRVGRRRSRRRNRRTYEREEGHDMNSWIDLHALWQIVVVGLLAGAGLPALFAVGLVALSAPAPRRATGRAGLRPHRRRQSARDRRGRAVLRGRAGRGRLGYLHHRQRLAEPDHSDDRSRGRHMALPPFLSSVIGWLRAGYPEGVPQHDYLPLFALLASQLTDAEVNAIADELINDADPDSADAIRAAIASVTHTHPTDSDVARVRARLAAGGWPLAAPEQVKPTS